jgi:hypothetical protein
MGERIDGDGSAVSVDRGGDLLSAARTGAARSIAGHLVWHEARYRLG